jgi:hypothetical protein
MTNDVILSQAESKLLSDYLREKKFAEIPNGLVFWRKSPKEISESAKKKYGKELAVEIVLKAIGRTSK